MDTPWRIQMFGGLRAERGGEVVERFYSQKAGALLAYLALHCDRSHPREVLIELVWPGGEPGAGRTSLRRALSSLRSQFEPPDIQAGSVIKADRSSVQLSPDAITTDVAEFEAALRSADQATSDAERAKYLTEAVELYRGEFLSGYYEDWIQTEQRRLADLYFQAVRRLTAHFEKSEAWERALDYARRAVAVDPLREDAHQDLMHLLAAAGQRFAALRQFKELERILKEELDVEPSDTTLEFAREIEQRIADNLNSDIQVLLTPEHRRAIEEFRKRHRTAVLSLVFTDVEHSTRLHSEMGDEPATALIERHKALLRKVLAGFTDAQEISTAGGLLLLVFAKPSDAARFALVAQLRLRELAARERPDFRVNMGIHLGEVVVEEEGEGGPVYDVLGMQVNIAACVKALAAGGQILMTAGVFDNARRILKAEQLPGIGELSWLNHGPYLLQGFEEPLSVCEVGEVGTAPLSPPADCEAGKSASPPGSELVLGWRPAVEQVVPSTQWVLEEKLGEGGFGEVWRARHQRTKDSRIFKFCFRADRLRALKREMTLFRLLKETLGDRADIARLYNVQFETAPYYLEIEDTPGGNLAEWIERQGGCENVSPALRLEIVAQIATALAAAHSVGVIHRDVKPSNILIEEVGRVANPSTGVLPSDRAGRVSNPSYVQVRLTDFGIGEVIDRDVLARAGITVTGFTETFGPQTRSSYSGTRLYMAPELTVGRPPSIQSDIYSLGVLLYQMVIGDLSQPMATDWERHIEDPLLREDLHGCLAGDPADRFGSADQLAKRLRTLEQRRARRREREAAERAHARRRMLARTIGAAAAVLLLMALALGYGLYRERVQHLRANAAREDAEQQLYYSNIALAADYIDESRYAPARDLLLASPLQHRHWEWRYLLRACSRDVATLEGHANRIYALDFSPDGKYLLTGSADRTARIWEWETGAEIRRFESGAEIHAVAFGPQGRRIAVTYGQKIGDGKYEDVGNTVRVFDRETGRLQVELVGHTNDVNGVAFSPDGKLLGTASSDSTAKIWNLETGKEQVSFRKHHNGVFSIAFDPTGDRVVTGGADSIARVWDTATGNEQSFYTGHAFYVIAARFTPDGTRLVTASADQTVQISSLKTNKRIRTLMGHTVCIRSIDVSADGRLVASAGDDQAVRIWDLETGEEVQVLHGHDGPVQCVKFGPEPFVLASAGSDMSARVWHQGAARTETVLPEFAGCIYCAFSPDGSRLAVCADKERVPGVWDMASGVEICPLPRHAMGPRSIAYSPDGRVLATGSMDRAVRIFDASSGKLLKRFEAHDSPISCVAFSPDGARLVSTAGFGAATIWDTATWREIVSLEGLPARVESADFSPNGGRVVAAASNEAFVFGANSGRLLHTLKGHSRLVRQARFSPDGRKIATASSDRSARVWEAETGRELLSLTHSQPVDSVCFSPDGKRVVTGANDGLVRIWDLDTGQALVSLSGHERAVTYVGFSPDGERLATADSYGRVIIRDSFSSEFQSLIVEQEETDRDSLQQAKRALLQQGRDQVAKGLFSTGKPTRSRNVVPVSEKLARRQIERCVHNLQSVHNAIVKYRREHGGAMPDWLSDLAPRYIGAHILRCPADPEGVTSFSPDPHAKCSYTYEFSPTFLKSHKMTCKEWKTQQLDTYGEQVPTVRCFHHNARGWEVLNLSYGGKVYWSPGGWEQGQWMDVQLETPLALIERCAENMRAIHEALDQYRADHGGEMPNWLSDLTSSSLDVAALTCPNQRAGWWALPKDPKLACGYQYLFADTVFRDIDVRKMGMEALKEQGESAPTVQCPFHDEYGLRMTYGGELSLFHNEGETEPYPFPYPRKVDEDALLQSGALLFRQGSYPNLEYDGCRDAHILFNRSDSAGHNCGNYEVLEEGDGLGGTLDHKKILVSFDLSAASSTFSLARAELRLFNFRERTERLRNRHTIYVARLLKPWEEGKGDNIDGERPTSGSVTFLSARANVEKWESQGAAGITDVADAESSATIGGNWPEWVRLDVTESVRHFLAHPEENFGWKISQDNRRGVEDSTISYAQGIFMFKSSEALQDYLRPTLVLYPSGLTPDPTDTAPLQPWTLIAEARKEFDRLASTFHCGAPVRTPEDARRGAEAWSGYLDKFASAFHRIDEATQYRDWYQSWLADGATLDAIRDRSSSEEPATGTLRVVDLGEGLKLELVWIPTGEFIIGSPPDEAGRGQNEGPQTWVPVEGFWTGKYEVTVGQFRKFVEETSYETDAEKAGESGGPSAQAFFGMVPGLTWRNPGFEQTESHPVVCVSWNDAMAFCRWLSQKTGTSFTLPTEAQAEYTCRAGSTTSYPWGDDPGGAQGKANIADRKLLSRFPDRITMPWDDGCVFTAPVGSFPPNAWGLYERIGNVNEWCLSLEKPYPYRETDGRNDTMVGGLRVVRGWTFCDGADSYRSARRHFLSQYNSSIYDGFRVVQLNE